MRQIDARFTDNMKTKEEQGTIMLISTKSRDLPGEYSNNGLRYFTRRMYSFEQVSEENANKCRPFVARQESPITSLLRFLIIPDTLMRVGQLSDRWQNWWFYAEKWYLSQKWSVTHRKLGKIGDAEQRVGWWKSAGKLMDCRGKMR